MELKENVCAREYAVKLKELGVKQDSLFNWIEENQYGDDWDLRVESSEYEFDCPIKIIAAAFTVAELGALLPMQITFQDKLYFFMAWKRKNGFAVIYKPNEGRNYFPAQFAIKEADARAKMRIYLIEHKLV